jgi:hypothetical protein
MDSFRRELAGLEDPAGDGNNDAYKAESLKLCVCLAELFGDELDRKTLWTRIESGIKSAASKHPEGGDTMLNAAVEHVMADPGKAAANERFESLVLMADQQTSAWNRGWASYIQRHSLILIAHARNQWQQIKENK